MSFQTYEEAISSLTDEELGDEICSKQRIQQKCSPDSADWQRASKVLAVFFAEAKVRAENGSVIRSL